MAYVIVQNRKTVLLGPMEWRQRFFQAEINDLVDAGELSIQYQVPPISQGYVDVGDGIEIFPIVENIMIDHDPMFERLIGPHWVFDDGKASSIYDKMDLELDLIRSNLKGLAASVRYQKENSIITVTVQGIDVTIDISRENRNIFVQKYLMMGENETVDWKFPETWLNLTKADLSTVVTAGADYIQSLFNWELDICNQINAATSVSELKAIEITNTAISRPSR